MQKTYSTHNHRYRRWEIEWRELTECTKKYGLQQIENKKTIYPARALKSGVKLGTTVASKNPKTTNNMQAGKCGITERGVKQYDRETLTEE